MMSNSNQGTTLAIRNYYRGKLTNIRSAAICGAKNNPIPIRRHNDASAPTIAVRIANNGILRNRRSSLRPFSSLSSNISHKQYIKIRMYTCLGICICTVFTSQNIVALHSDSQSTTFCCYLSISQWFLNGTESSLSAIPAVTHTYTDQQ